MDEPTVSPRDGKTPIFGTVTLSPAMLSVPMLKQLMRTFEYVHNLMTITESEWHFCYEITKQGNIHYHFLYWCVDPGIDIPVMIDSFKTMRKKCDDKYINLFGFSKIEVSIHPEKVIEYLLKDIFKTKAIINRLTSKKDFFDSYPIYNNFLDKRVVKLKSSRIKAIKALNTSMLDLDEEIV